MACACDEKINIVDSSNASVRATLDGDTKQVTALTLNPNGKLLFSASHSRLIRFWRRYDLGHRESVIHKLRNSDSWRRS
ncbi:hypothetical protein QJS10_CPB20g01380 [Acorus calamus]|uniref:Uncharacterized protein n=1 Tax=Acorus calamus TaxID=4465 RepID=A0AAV9C9A5_ACOCL|nr:hypothetical protein QJS10_CPB20g01380 [Acorus calamus]